MEKKRIKLEEVYPIIKETLANGGTVELPITGTSMLPLLVQGRDTVTLRAATLPLKKYDLPLYRRKDGAFILHRVLNADKKSYTMCGDNQWVLEEGIEDEQIVGLVCAITRNGKQFPVESKKYQRYCKLWHFLMPIRRYIVAIRGRLKG